jgi:GcrA cell cycle regulator
MTTPPLPWTAERVRTLERLWLEGLTAVEIARSLAGGVTRNAVIGKAHRLGLAKRRSPAVNRSGRAVRAPMARVRRPGPMIVGRSRPIPAQVFPMMRPVDLPGLATVLTVIANACRWPCGDPTDAGFALCGRLATRGAYCAAHASVAYQDAAASARADRRLTGGRP